MMSDQVVRNNWSQGDLENALAKIPLGKKVAALTVDKRAATIKSGGFHHFGAYAQAERGGLTMFSFATMPHWPIQIRPEAKIPKLSSKFQFDPRAVTLSDVNWADYALLRGAVPDAVSQRFRPIYSGAHWQVLARKQPEDFRRQLLKNAQSSAAPSALRN